MNYFLAAAIAILMTAAALAQTASLPEIRSLAQQSRYQEAYDQLETYLSRRPADEQGRLLKGVLLTRLDRIDEAIEAFRDLAGDKPTLPEPYNNLAVLYAAEGRYDEARQSLEKAVALQPGYATARENLGDIYARLAHLEYMRAYEIDGTNTRALDKANTVVNLFERIARGNGATVPVPEPEPIMASAVPEPAAPMPAPLPEPTTAPPPRASASDAVECFGISGLKDEGDAAAVVAWFEQRGVSALSGMREEKEYLNFQVYSPPLESRSEAKALVSQMKAAGIKDISLIYKGDLRNGVSLGVYSSEANAKRRMTMLRQMGYQVENRHRSRTRQAPFVEATTLNGAVNQEAFRRAFPDLSVTRISCI
ncbi:MAG: tetratricopeptide repeat protein [Gammaproteobacteria bacterium]|nr:tetratricopeptide repeat protein [Gammaproteobacteria bacterium]